MKVFHLEFAKTGSGLSGGEKSMVEIIKFLRGKGIKNILLTTDNGKRLYETLGLVEGPCVHYVVINSEYTEKYHIFFSYIIRLYLFKKIKKEIIDLIDRKEDILMCHSDFFPNSISAYLLSKYFLKKPFFWFHMQAPDIFKGYTGQFTGKLNFPDLKIVHYKLNQILYFLIAKNGTIISVNPYYKNLFKQRSIYILKKFGGEDISITKREIQNYKNKEYKKYDVVFMGRFHAQKGLMEIPFILKKLKEKENDVKLLIIGGGDNKIEAKLKSALKKEGLTENVEFKGIISTDEKFDYLRQAKVFIFPSYYESFGLVALEAMANGLPVVAYDLPVFCVFENGMVKVPILDNVIFANEIYRLLSDDEYYRRISQDALLYSSTFSWKRTGEEVYHLISDQ